MMNSRNQSLLGHSFTYLIHYIRDSLPFLCTKNCAGYSRQQSEQYTSLAFQKQSLVRNTAGTQPVQNSIETTMIEETLKY